MTLVQKEVKAVYKWTVKVRPVWGGTVTETYTLPSATWGGSNKSWVDVYKSGYTVKSITFTWSVSYSWNSWASAYQWVMPTKTSNTYMEQYFYLWSNVSWYTDEYVNSYALNGTNYKSSFDGVYSSWTGTKQYTYTLTKTTFSSTVDGVTKSYTLSANQQNVVSTIFNGSTIWGYIGGTNATSDQATLVVTYEAV